MTQVVRAPPGEINAPRVYAYRDYLPNDINAEVVLLEKVHIIKLYSSSVLNSNEYQGPR